MEITKCCPRCKEVKAQSCFHRCRQAKDGFQLYCKRCNIDNATSWTKARRKKNIDKARRSDREIKARHRKRYKDRARAREVVTLALKHNRLIPGPCAKKGCKADKTEAHHSDYSKPLDIIWFCRPHHLEVHKEDSAR